MISALNFPDAIIPVKDPRNRKLDPKLPKIELKQYKISRLNYRYIWTQQPKQEEGGKSINFENYELQYDNKLIQDWNE
ncbi:MAG: hypothetical protein EZS28_012258 [Streblomastix strix]|uniref:Uncharacterized protein n=1 Tax=Streblomastix strix TaxID=222440 RepID=A0A5J4WBA0_9EUKA|nr:MAG: hypothetical protein EZS28_012258 [Streblomastix strix]